MYGNISECGFIKPDACRYLAEIERHRSGNQPRTETDGTQQSGEKDTADSPKSEVDDLPDYAETGIRYRGFKGSAPL